jgi:serine/threonine protein kinase
MKIEKGLIINQTFQIESSLSERGGTAAVYLASRVDNNGLKAAIKLARSDVTGAMDEDVLLRHEVDLLKKPSWHHPGVVRVFPLDYRESTEYILKATGIEGDPSYMVMEYLRGYSMSENLNQILSFSFQWKLEFLYQLAVVLSFIHAKGYGHRDLKPDNIVFREPISQEKLSQPVLIDFALTSNGLEQSRLIDQSFTLEYAAPERVLVSMGMLEDVALDPCAQDIWSYGVIMYELFTGVLPFQGTDKEIRTKLISDNLDQGLVRGHPLLPRDIARVIRGILRQKPGKRPSIEKIIMLLEQKFSPPRI